MHFHYLITLQIQYSILSDSLTAQNFGFSSLSSVDSNSYTNNFWMKLKFSSPLLIVPPQSILLSKKEHIFWFKFSARMLRHLLFLKDSWLLMLTYPPSCSSNSSSLSSIISAYFFLERLLIAVIISTFVIVAVKPDAFHFIKYYYKNST